MEKVEEFIREHKKDWSYEWYDDFSQGYEPWLTTEYARSVAEIAREETINEICELLKNNIAEYILPNKGLDLDWFIEDLKKYLEGKV